MKHTDRRISGYFAIGSDSSAEPKLNEVITSYLRFCFEVVVCDSSGDDAHWSRLLELAASEARLRLLRRTQRSDSKHGDGLALAREACRGAYVFEGDARILVDNANRETMQPLLETLGPEHPLIALPALYPQRGAEKLRRDRALSRPCLSRNDPTLSHDESGRLFDRTSGARIVALETMPAMLEARRVDGSDAAQFSRDLAVATCGLPVLWCFENADPIIPTMAASVEPELIPRPELVGRDAPLRRTVGTPS